VIGGGWVGDSAFPEHGTIRLDQLAENLRLAAQVVPTMGDLPLLRTWAGYDGASSDAMPIIAPLPGWPAVTVSTGARAGFSCGPIWGELTCDLLLGRKMRWDKGLFTLDRFAAARPTAA
jgi:glycine/D-amino acid oxidase-like deaminating enzyme